MPAKKVSDEIIIHDFAADGLKPWAIHLKRGVSSERIKDVLLKAGFTLDEKPSVGRKFEQHPNLIKIWVAPDLLQVIKKWAKFHLHDSKKHKQYAEEIAKW